MERCRLVLCGHLAVFMTTGVSSAVDCGSWVAAVRVRLVCWGVHVMWCLWSFLPWWGFGGTLWGMVGVMGCLWWVSTKPLGQACWRCLVVPVLFRLRVPLGISTLGRNVLHPSYVLFWWTGCVWVVVVWLLWSASGSVDVWPVWCLYGVAWYFLSLWM